MLELLQLAKNQLCRAENTDFVGKQPFVQSETFRFWCYAEKCNNQNISSNRSNMRRSGVCV